MITSYEVGGVYRIVDQATPTLLKIAGLLEKISGLSKQVEAHFSGLGAVRVGNLTKNLGTLESRLGGVAKSADLAREGMVTAFTKADGSVDRTTASVARLTAELKVARGEAAALRIPGSGGRGPGGTDHPRPGGGRGPGGGSGGGSHSPSQAGHTGVQLGVLGFFGAEAVGHGLKEVLKDASELEHVRQQMVQAGFKEAEIAKATAAAWEEARKYGINVSKVMGDIKELTLPLGSIEHAIDFIGPLEKMRVVLNAVSEGRGTSSADAVYKMARAGELKGLQTPEEFESYFNNMTKVISASGGKVTPNDFMQFAKYGKLSTMGFNEDFFTRYAPTLIQTMGASTAGTAAQSLFGTLVQGTVSKRALGRMDALGLIEDPSKIIYDNKGDPKGFNPGAIAGTELLVKNPFEWAQKVLLPLLEKKYGTLDDAGNKQKAIEDLGGLFGNRNSAAAIAELALRGKTFNKDAGLIDQARGISGADAMLKEDPKAVAEKLKGAWENLMTALGGPGVKVAVEAMNSLASGITSMTKWATENPTTTKIILEGLLGLAGALTALTVAGAVAGALALAPGGAVALAVSTLVSVLGTIAGFNWKSLTELLSGPMNAVISFFERLKAAVGGGADKKSLNPSDELPGLGGLIQKQSFSGGDGAMRPLAEGVYQGVLRAFRELMGGGGSGGGGTASSMFQTASFSTGGEANDNAGGGSFGGASGVGRALGRGGMSGGGGSALGSIGMGGDYLAQVGGKTYRSAYQAGGRERVGSWLDMFQRPIDKGGLGMPLDKARAMVAMMQGESGINLNPGAIGDHGTAFGTGQWRLGRARNLMGMARAMGLDWRDPRAQQAHMRAEMLGLYGKGGSYRSVYDAIMAAPSGDHALAIGIDRFENPAKKALAYRFRHPYLQGLRRSGAGENPTANAPAPPTAGPPPRKQEQPGITHVHLDGKVIAKAVTTRIADGSRYPRHVGGMDTHGSWRPPGTTLTDAA